MIDEKRIEELYEIIKEKAVPIIKTESEAYYIFDSHYGEAPEDWHTEVDFEGKHYHLDPDERYSYKGARRAIRIQKSLGVNLYVKPDCGCDLHYATCIEPDGKDCECIKDCECEMEEINMVHPDHWNESDRTHNCPVTGVPLRTELLDDAIESELDHFIDNTGKININTDIEKSDDLYWLYRLLHEINYSHDQRKKYGERIIRIADYAIGGFSISNWLAD